MSHSFYKIWIIWATKLRVPLLHQGIEYTVYSFQYQQFRELACPLRIINDMPDHIHRLFLLNAQKSVADVIKQVKGSSAHFINQNDLIAEKFSWQTGYAAFSVSESGAEKVFQYIKNQKQHHQGKTSEQEQSNFLTRYGIQGPM
ncbi:MAG: transposase [Chitinophagaceae bacterium]|nr:transposase [Chitinophagaceae bacterium]